MAKQIYIDENGNEVPVSGTIATAGNLPLGSDFSDPTSTAGAIGDLTTLTTTDKSSAVGAINEVDADLATKAPIDYFNRYDFSSSQPIVISNVGAYHCFLIVGFVQGIGVLTVVVKIVNGTVSTVDFITGASFSNANITFSYTSGTKKLTITTPQAGGSYLAIMRTGSM